MVEAYRVDYRGAYKGSPPGLDGWSVSMRTSREEQARDWAEDLREIYVNVRIVKETEEVVG